LLPGGYMRLNAFLSLLLLFCLPAVPSCAAIPLITDDSGMQGKGKFQRKLFAPFNAGYTRNESSLGERTDLWSYSVAASVEFIEDVYVAACLGVRTNTDRESSTYPAYLLIGFISSPAENIDLGLGLKFSLNSAEDDYTVRGGTTFRV